MITNIIISKPPLNGIEFKEAIDLGLVCAAFEHQVNLVFTDDGVICLLKKQNAAVTGDKNQVDILKGLEFYDIDNIYLEKEALKNSSIKTADLINNVQLIDSVDLNQLNKAANNLVSF